jgi:probable metal-binding protein
MPATAHGHEILHLIIGAAPGLTRDELRRMTERRFGSECRFHTCSASGMDFDELLRFLEGRGKIAFVDGTVTADPAAVCDHD